MILCTKAVILLLLWLLYVVVVSCDYLFLGAVERCLREKQARFINVYTTIVISIVRGKCSHQISFSVSRKQINTINTQLHGAIIEFQVKYHWKILTTKCHPTV